MKKQITGQNVNYGEHELPIDTKTNWKQVDALTYDELEENARKDADTLLADDNFWEVAQLTQAHR